MGGGGAGLGGAAKCTPDSRTSRKMPKRNCSRTCLNSGP